MTQNEFENLIDGVEILDAATSRGKVRIAVLPAGMPGYGYSGFLSDGIISILLNIVYYQILARTAKRWRVVITGATQKTYRVFRSEWMARDDARRLAQRECYRARTDERDFWESHGLGR